MITSNFDSLKIKIFHRQLKIFSILMFLTFGVILFRFLYLQIMNGQNYREKSEQNRIRIREIAPLRGIIKDRNGEPLATNRPSFNLCVVPEEITNTEEFLTDLNKIIPLDMEASLKAIKTGRQRAPFRQVCIKKDMTRDELATIETFRFNLNGVLVSIEPRRNYMNGMMASHILGYLGEITEEQLKNNVFPKAKQGDFIGKSGVEYQCEKQLAGESGGMQLEVDAVGRIIEIISNKPPKSGSDVFLTLDADLQRFSENIFEEHNGAIVAMDPMNGKILALVSNPAFDPNLFIGGISHKEWQELISSKNHPLQNRALSGQYPPGSIFKIIVGLAALEEKIVTPQTSFFCSGNFSLGTGSYNCWNKHGHGNVKLHDAIVESCDVYFYEVGRKLGIDMIAKYAAVFGMGSLTGFDAGAERRGLVPTKEWKQKKFGEPWQTGETITTAIGQSYILVTPMQTACFMSAVFNGGILHTPRIIEHIDEGIQSTVSPFSSRLNAAIQIKPENMELMKNALAATVNSPRGTGKNAKIDHIEVAGKTGTAQVVSLEVVKSYKDESLIPKNFRDHAWFVATAPKNDPKITVAVLVEHGGGGGRIAAPIAKEIINAYLDNNLRNKNIIISSELVRESLN